MVNISPALILTGACKTTVMQESHLLQAGHDSRLARIDLPERSTLTFSAEKGKCIFFNERLPIFTSIMALFGF